MSDPTTYQEKHIAIFGAGRSGRAAARLALKLGAKVSVWDELGSEAFSQIPDGVAIHPDMNLDQAEKFSADLIVISPGIDTYSPLVSAFAVNTPMIGETEFASQTFHGDIIGITGTNGKTTTTELISRILKFAGKGGTPCGNYGAPLSEIVLGEEKPQAVSLELSSFQLETIDTLHPKISVWLNFAPDHMDRYPTIEAYKKAKLAIFKNQTSEDTIIVRHGEELGNLSPKILTFSTEHREADFFSDGLKIFHKEQIIFDLEADTDLRGLHNAENAMAAIAACMAYGIDLSIMPIALRACSPPPHRCEFIRNLNGVDYLNDSKATNLHALESALRSQVRPVILIAGGKDKGLDYSKLLPLLEMNTLSVITFGQIGHDLATLFSSCVKTYSVSTLAEAVLLARNSAPSGSTVLFSPGTSSFDQFNGYEQRGNTFRDLVLKLEP